MRERTVRDIELDKVLLAVRSHSLSPEGRDAISPDLFTSDEAAIEKRAETIALYISYSGKSAPESFPPVSPVLEWIGTTHMDLPGQLIRDAGHFIASFASMRGFAEKEAPSQDLVQLSEDILASLDQEGEVYENHPRLLPFMKRLENARKERLRFSSAYIRENRGIVQQSEPMYRNERIVIPIASTARRSGVYITGTSSSGATLFAEPFELVSLNNSVVVAEEAIRAEKAKILHELADSVRTLLCPELPAMLEEVIDFDFHYSFALWAKKEKAIHPERGILSLKEARHPLLGRDAVPISISLEEGTRGIVLSGANAGGKTVTMKTVALLAALNQIAGFIPAAAGTLPLYSAIFTDIGDGQSIEDAVSTFSSHMKNIAEIAAAADSRSLVILDELGSGTDPDEGAALSSSILRYFSGHAALVIITSHYSAIKSFAYSEPSLMNASMEFNERSGLPTYRVLEGIPGESYALLAARRAKLPKEITDRAELSLRGGDESSARIIRTLLSKERALDRKITENAILKREIEQERQALREREAELDSLENDLRKDGVREISQYLKESRKTLENLIAELRTGATTERIRKAKAFMKDVEAKRDEEEAAIEEDVSDESFSPGDAVSCGKAGTKGEVISVSGSDVLVMLENGLRMTLKKSMVKHREKEAYQKASLSLPSMRKASYTIDVRGLTLEETLRRLDDQIEAAIISDLSEFSIIHGYGDGILSRGVHDYLSRRKEVKDYHFAHPDDGGMGKTYVLLRG